MGDTDRVERWAQAYHTLREEIAKVIVGQNAAVEELVMALLCRGHAILVGLPGLAKTLLVKALARALSLSFHRIQFTPDLMPSDITGTEVLQDVGPGQREFRFARGPVFTQMLLADEINRTPPKTQAALLEAMQERHVTAGNETHSLPSPFFVVATQNPIEQEGTYELPEAQLDRFLFSIQVGYPSEEEELEVMRRSTAPDLDAIASVLDERGVLEAQALVPRVPAPDHVYRYALALVRSTRPDDPRAPEFVRRTVTWGAGPRASQHLVLAARANALLRGDISANVDDVKRVARSVLAHRIVPNFHASAEGLRPADIVERLLDEAGTNGTE